MFLFHVKGVEGAKIHSIECMCEILYKKIKAMLKMSKMLAACSLQNISIKLYIVEDIKDIKTSHNRLH